MKEDLKNIIPNLPEILKRLRCGLEQIKIKSIDNFFLNPEGDLVLEYTDSQGAQSFSVNLAVLEKLEIQYNVLNFNELNAITDAELYAFAYVRESQGVQFINYKGSGLYIWDGTTWAEDDTDVFTQLQSLIDTLALIQNQINVLQTLKLDKGSYDGNASDLDDNISIEAAERASEDSILQLQIDNHVNDNNNPHNVTRTQLGLENVDNTSDFDKPISNATQLELVNKVNSSSLGATAFSNDYNDLYNLPTTTNGANSFEGVSKNLRSWGYTLNYTGSKLTSIDYSNGANTITKTLNYTNGILTSIVLSGDTPSGISINKTLTYTGSSLTSITYS